MNCQIERFYVGEKPYPLQCRYENGDGTLNTDIAGKTLSAYVSLNGGTATVITPLTNPGDGTFAITFPNATGTLFTDDGEVRFAVLLTDGDNEIWLDDPITLPVEEPLSS